MRPPERTFRNAGAVGTLTDDVTAHTPLRPPVKHPHGWEPGYMWDGSAGTITTKPLTERPKTWDDFITDAGLDPAEVEVVGQVNVRGWDMNIGDGNVVRA